MITGIYIASRYKKYKKEIFLYWGIAWIGFYEPWWGPGFSFLSYLLTGQPLSPFMYLLLGNIFVPLFVILWMMGFTEMIYQNKRKILIIIYLTISAVAEIFLIYALITDVSILIEFTGIFDVTFSRIWLAYLLFISFTIAIMGIIVAWHSLKSDDRELRFQGKILLLAFILYPTCAILDGGIELNEIGLIIVRSLLIIESLLFYIGFVVLKFIKKKLKFEEMEESETKSTEQKDEIQEFLKMVSIHKKETYTEEEILYHKEKRICLVCKGKISRRKKYVCPKCDILYCIRCSIALSSLENICWVCETTIDPSKPVKISETTEEIIPDKKKLLKKK